MADETRGMLAVEANPPLALTNVKRRGLASGCDELLKDGAHVVGQIESILVLHTEPPQRRSQSEAAVGTAIEIAEPLERCGEPQNGTVLSMDATIKEPA